MAPPVECVMEDPGWEGRGLPDLADRAASAALAEAGLDPAACEIVLLACDDARIAALNARFRDRETATNVLAFPTAAAGAATFSPPDGGPRELGAIALARQTALAEAAASGVPVADHLSHLVVHATLHLLGHDHESDAQAARMEALEVAALARLGVADPYSRPVAMNGPE